MTGVFITFEGADGAGKTTQINLLAEHLRNRGYTVRCTREPGGTVLSDHIRNLLLDPSNHGMDARAEALLYMAARAQHVAEFIRPALECGEIVMSDRYADSTVVYQGKGRNLNKEELLFISNFAAAGVKPDLTILLDGDTEMLRSRMIGRGTQDRIEQEADSFHEAVRQGFLEIAAAEPTRTRVVDIERSIPEIHETIKLIVEDFLNRRAESEN